MLVDVNYVRVYIWHHKYKGGELHHKTPNLVFFVCYLEIIDMFLRNDKASLS